MFQQSFSTIFTDKVRLLFLSHFGPFLKKLVYFEALALIILSLKPSHYNQVKPN